MAREHASERISMSELQTRLLTATKLLDKLTLPPNSKQVLSYATGVLLRLAASDPHLVAQLIGEMNESIDRVRAKRRDA